MFESLIEEMATLSPSELDDVVSAAELDRRQADVRLAAAVAVIESRQLFQDHGHRSIRGYLKRELNCSGTGAGRIRRRAVLVNRYPSVGEALFDGRVGTEQVDRLAVANGHRRAGDRFVEFAPMLLNHAERLEYNDFAKAVAHFETQADEDGAFDDQAFQENERRAAVSITNGAIDLHASGGGPSEAEEMTSIFQRAVEDEFQKDCEARRTSYGDDALEHPLGRTIQQRSFDALYEIFVKSVTAPADGKRPEPLVSFVIDPATGIEALARHGLLDIDDVDDVSVDPAARRCATDSGTPVHSDIVVKAMLRGSVQRVMVDAHDVVINHGRRQRLFTGKAREAAQLLVTTCGHRGCDVPAEFCDVDHVNEWDADGGETNQDNAMPLCGVHDRWKHRQRLRGRRDRHGRIHLVKPDGAVIKPVGARDPEWADPEPLQLPMPQWRTVTWEEMTASSPRLRGRPDPGWTMKLMEFPAA